jgi:oligopeptide transport system substrate-binding protein
MRRLLIPLVLVVALTVGAVLVASRTPGPQADLVWTAGGEVGTLDPALMTTVQDSRVAAALFEGLTVFDPSNLSVRSGVARRWTVSADKLHYVFDLREEARWSDGRPVTSEDFVYAWRRVLDPRTAAQYAYMLYPIRGAEAYYAAGAAGDPSTLGFRAEGPHRLAVDLERPTAYFLDLAAFSTYLPVRRDVVEAHAEHWTHPPNLVSNGPYRLAAWHFGSRMVWRKNPHYWAADRVALESVEVRVFEEDQTAFQAYEIRAVDLTTVTPALARQPLLDLQAEGRRGDVTQENDLGTYFYRFNCTAAPFDDARVRRALALAIDRQAIIERAARGGQRPAGALVPPDLPGYTSPPGLSEDVEEARRLLAEAGYPDGRGMPEFSILVNKGMGHVPVAEMVMDQWKTRLGLRVRTEQMEFKVFQDRVRQGQYQVARAGWYGDYMDPNTFLDMFVTGGGNNETGWSSPDYDDLIGRAAREPDAAARMRLLARAEAILLAETPILPLYYYTTLVLVRPGLEGVYSNPLNRIDFTQLRWAGGRRP